jgi:hypothetical protein
MFPKTKDFKSVETDKSAFPYTSNTTINSPKAGAASESSSVVPYNDMFKLRNMQSVRHSFLSGNISLTAL